jgi:hypothetical protein
MQIQVRKALAEDIPVLRELIEASVRGLQAGDYSPAQIEAALKTVYGVDTQLIADGTYLVAEVETPTEGSIIIGCGGWSKRRTLYGDRRRLRSPGDGSDLEWRTFLHRQRLRSVGKSTGPTRP